MQEIEDEKIITDANSIMVSVYCVTYNQEQYIKDAIEGILNQEVCFKFEIIIHDDASTDGTAEIVKKYAERYPEIVIPILCEENQYSKGVENLFKSIYSWGRGKYVALCEGDDYWSDVNKLQKQVDFLEKNNQFVGCAHNTLLINIKEKEDRVLFPQDKDRIISFKNALKGGGSNYHTSSLMCRRSIFCDYVKEMPDFSMPMLRVGIGDYPLNIFISLYGRIYCFKEVMSVYRWKTDESWSSEFQAGNVEYTKQLAEAKKKMLLLLKEHVGWTKKLEVVRAYSAEVKDEVICMAEVQNKKEILRRWKMIVFYSPYVQLYIIVRTFFNGIYQLYKKIMFKF